MLKGRLDYLVKPGMVLRLASCGLREFGKPGTLQPFNFFSRVGDANPFRLLELDSPFSFPSILVWLNADAVYSGRRFITYALTLKADLPILDSYLLLKVTCCISIIPDHVKREGKAPMGSGVAGHLFYFFF
jgi:hypothetical protein